MTDAETITSLEEQVRWWVKTCSIKDDQYRALLNLIVGQREAVERLRMSLNPEFIERYIRTVVPT